MGQGIELFFDVGRHSAALRYRRGALRRVNMIQNGHVTSPGTPRVDGWSRTMVQNGHMASPGTVLRGLVRISGGPQRVHGVSWDGLERSCEGLWRS